MEGWDIEGGDGAEMGGDRVSGVVDCGLRTRVKGVFVGSWEARVGPQPYVWGRFGRPGMCPKYGMGMGVTGLGMGFVGHPVRLGWIS